jgi:hypothetical protein
MEERSRQASPRPSRARRLGACRRSRYEQKVACARKTVMSKRLKINRVKIDWDGLETRRKWDRIPPCQGARDQDRGRWWPIVALVALLTSIGFAVVAPRLLHAAMGL